MHTIVIFLFVNMCLVGVGGVTTNGKLYVRNTNTKNAKTNEVCFEM